MNTAVTLERRNSVNNSDFVSNAKLGLKIDSKQFEYFSRKELKLLRRRKLSLAVMKKYTPVQFAKRKSLYSLNKVLMVH